MLSNIQEFIVKNFKLFSHQTAKRRQSIVGALKGLLAIASVAAGLAAQPGSPINNFLTEGLQSLLGRLATLWFHIWLFQQRILFQALKNIHWLRT